MAIVAKRYIDALYESTKNKAERDEIEGHLREFVNVFNSNQELKRVLLDPRLMDDLKIEIMNEIISSSNSIFINFINLLIREKRINLINEMLLEYESINRNSKKELLIKIIVSDEITESQTEKIIEKMKKIYKVNTVNYNIEIDKEILGGIKVIVGNTVYDSSIKTQLNQIF